MNRVGWVMGTGFSPEEEALYRRTAGAVLKALRRVRRPEELLAVVRRAQRRFDDAYAAAPVEARAAVACRAGCDTCCHELVAVQAHEVLITAEHIQRTFSPAELEAVVARAAVHAAAHASPAVGDSSLRRTPCVLLREGCCSIYEARPEACRSHHSPSVEACRANLASGRETTDTTIPGLRGRMFAVMLAIDQAVEETGLDGQAYDFGSALHEALTDGLCAVRWMRGEPAFSASSRE